MLALVMCGAAGAAARAETVALTLCPTAAEALDFTAAPTASVAKPNFEPTKHLRSALALRATRHLNVEPEVRVFNK